MRPILVPGGDLGAGRAPHCAGFRKWTPFRGRRQWPQASRMCIFETRRLFQLYAGMRSTLSPPPRPPPPTSEVVPAL